MLRHLLTVSGRRLRHSTATTLLNVAGLAIGFACAALLALWVRHELSYDRHHEHAERVHRVALDMRFGDDAVETALTAPGLAALLEAELPGVEAATRLWRDPSGAMTLRRGEAIFPEPNVVFADADVFEVLSFGFLRGGPSAALAEPNTLVLTRRMAEKYFGAADPVGQTLALREPSDRDWFEYRVTGVIEDPPAQTHFPVDVLASFASQRFSRSESLLGFGLYTYVKLRAAGDAPAVAAALPELVRTHVGAQVQAQAGMSFDAFERAGNGYWLSLQPLRDLHLRSHRDDEPAPTGDARYVYFLSAIAAFVMLLACVNFVNLTTARVAGRFRELGVRKALGSSRGRLMQQVLAEALLTSALAAVLALGIVAVSAPMLADGVGKDLLGALPSPLWLVLVVLSGAVLTGLVAGAYPALVLSGVGPARALRGGHEAGRGAGLRRALVVFQFAVTVVLIVGTLVVQRQMGYVQTQKLASAGEQVVVLEGTEVMGPRIEAFKAALARMPGVTHTTNAELLPGRPFAGSTFHPEGAPEREALLTYTYAGVGYAETLGLDVVAGRPLAAGRAEDSLAVLLNETAVHRLGLDDPIGKRLVWPGESVYTIVGVVADFHLGSLRSEVVPLALIGPDPRNTNRPNLLVAARVASADVPATLDAMEAAWRTFAHGYPFAYRFLDDDFDALYRSERLTGQALAGFGGVALLIACLGLFGLAAYTAERRRRELGVRKVLGASVPDLVGLLSWEYVRLVAAAFVLAAPVAAFLAARWLDGFAYRAALGPGVFAVAGGLALGVALATVSVHAFRAATADPVRALRSE